MSKHSHNHRRVSSPPSRSYSPETSQASQMRDVPDVAREQLNEALLSRGVLRFNNVEHSLRNDEFSLVEDNRRLPYEKNLRAAAKRHFLINGAVAEHGYRDRRSPVVRQSRMLWLPQPMRDEFRQPEKTVVCVRRKTRRSVLFALRQIGRGSGGRPRKAKWNETSRIVCRRR